VFQFIKRNLMLGRGVRLGENLKSKQLHVLGSGDSAQVSNNTVIFRLPSTKNSCGELNAHPLPRQQAEGDRAAGVPEELALGAIEMPTPTHGSQPFAPPSGYGSPSSKSEILQRTPLS